jgi:site-specific recombinase XerD
MKVKEAITLFQYYQRSSYKKRTIASYLYLLKKFESLYGERPFDSIEADEIYHFLETLTQDHAKSSRRLRYAQLKAFYNFIITRCSLDMKNPCNAPLLSETFRMPKAVSRKILDKEVVDEMIYNTQNPRDRLMLELQARCGLRIGESLKIKASDHPAMLLPVIIGPAYLSNSADFES